jgi:protein-S-isoprenylcysteine O-methyltransferase Ste14
MPVSAYIQAALFVLLNAVALFAAAGTVKILGFWVYVAIFAAVMVASFALLDPGLLRERMRPGGQRPPLALRLFTLVLLLHWIVAGLDRGRFHWSDDLPAWLRALGLIAVAAGYGLALWAMLVNRFFSSVVRIQSDRGQYVASGIALGSWLATALLIVLSLPFLLYRAITEDRVLQADLPGYRDYAARVRWRVLPGIW